MSTNQTSDALLTQRQLSQGAWIAAVAFAATFITSVSCFVVGCVVYFKYRRPLQPLVVTDFGTDVEPPTCVMAPMHQTIAVEVKQPDGGNETYWASDVTLKTEL